MQIGHTHRTSISFGEPSVWTTMCTEVGLRGVGAGGRLQRRVGEETCG